MCQKFNTWCPYCSGRYSCNLELAKKVANEKGEKLCKNVVTGSPDIRLELDIYYPQYGFSIEVQGIQHKRFHAFFHKDQEGIQKQFSRDQLKKELCHENWIVLIEVWYYEDPHTVIPQQLREGLIP
ncbi:hypothetical protein Glove_42g19 [Diversispora epigaea]|uniref:Uncharacterized protein n=1 Tax=Diversispora epigaea TaxID=1348612 RepID=A0A397JP14_9GLOM|nr:hypothetical protein Glove_42g19 [Diversispora epigaea]